MASAAWNVGTAATPVWLLRLPIYSAHEEKPSGTADMLTTAMEA